MILPSELQEMVLEQLQNKQAECLKYAKVIMSLKEMLEGDFFNEYIKKGIAVAQLILGSGRLIENRQHHDAV